MYVLQLYVDAQYTELKLPIDILIGTVPLRESVPAPQYDAVITNQPLSAPSITEQPDTSDLRMTNLLTSREICLFTILRLLLFSLQGNL